MHDEQKLENYKNRHRFWSEKTLEQFGIANNFFLAVGIAILGFVINEINEMGISSIKFGFCEIDWNLTWLLLSGILALMSTFFGAATLVSRLHDLRLTRHVSRIRLKAYSEEFGWRVLPSKFIKINESFFPLLLNFFGNISSRKYFVWEPEYKNSYESLNERFNAVRKRSLMLGRFSWKSFNFQILILMFSILSYSITLLV